MVKHCVGEAGGDVHGDGQWSCFLQAAPSNHTALPCGPPYETASALRLSSHVSRLSSHVDRLSSHVSRLSSHVNRLSSHVNSLATSTHCLATSTDCLATSTHCLATSTHCLATSTDCLVTPLDCLSMSTPTSRVDRTWDHLLLQFGLARREHMEISQSHAESAGPTTQPTVHSAHPPSTAVYTVFIHPANCVHSVHPPS